MQKFSIFIQDGEKHSVNLIGTIEAEDALVAIDMARSEYGSASAPLALVVTKNEAFTACVSRRREALDLDALTTHRGVARLKRLNDKKQLEYLGHKSLLQTEGLEFLEVV